jgi:hypothetical protein
MRWASRGLIGNTTSPGEAIMTDTGHMWRRLLGTLVVLWGLAAGAYLMWCQHRVSFPVLMDDRAWPRPWPYPDGWLNRWYDRIDAEYPAPPGGIRSCPETRYRLQGRLWAYTVSTFIIIAIGLAFVVWPPKVWQFSRGPSVQCGIAIGLIIGGCWSALVAHLTEGQLGAGSPSVWLSLGVYATGFAITGAVVGAVWHFPELVGLCAAVGTIMILAGGALPSDVCLDRFLTWNRLMTSRESVRIVAGIDWDPSWLVLFGGSGLLCGPVIGRLHRAFRPAVNDEPGGAEGMLNETGGRR